MRLQAIAVPLTVVNLVVLLTALGQERSSQPQKAVPLVRARVFELEDERGQLRARFNVESNGEVVLRLLDQKGTIRVKLGAAEKGSGLLLANDATEPGVHLLAQSTGSSVRLVNKDGHERVITP